MRNQKHTEITDSVISEAVMQERCAFFSCVMDAAISNRIFFHEAWYCVADQTLGILIENYTNFQLANFFFF